MWKLLESVTLGDMTALLKIMPVHKLNVRASGRVRCLLKNHSLLVHTLTRKHQSPCYISLSTGNKKGMSQISPFFVPMYLDECFVLPHIN